MALKINNPMPGLLRGYVSAGAPTSGTSQVDTITLANVTGGTFRLAFQGLRTGAIIWNAVTATLVGRIDAALEALPNVGVGEVTVVDVNLAGGNGSCTATWSGNCGTKALAGALTVYSDSTTGAGHSIAVTSPSTTPGVSATARGAAKGALLIRRDNGALYQNSGTPPACTWGAL